MYNHCELHLIWKWFVMMLEREVNTSFADFALVVLCPSLCIRKLRTLWSFPDIFLMSVILCRNNIFRFLIKLAMYIETFYFVFSKMKFCEAYAHRTWFCCRLSRMDAMVLCDYSFDTSLCMLLLYFDRCSGLILFLLFLLCWKFLLGSYCNHYFLRMLSSISKGQYDAAYDPGPLCFLNNSTSLKLILILQSSARDPLVSFCIICCMD